MFPGTLPAPKCSKTCLGLDLALRVATGTPCLVTVRDSALIGRRWPAFESRRILRCRLRCLQILETGHSAHGSPPIAAYWPPGNPRF